MQGTEYRIPEGIPTAIPYCCQDVRQSHMIKLSESNAVDFLCVIPILCVIMWSSHDNICDRAVVSRWEAGPRLFRPVTHTFYEGWNFNSGNYLFTTDTK